MPYSEATATTVRTLVADQPGVSERTMFGSRAFLVYGNLAIAVGPGGDDALMVRLHKDTAISPATQPGMTPTVMRGKEREGWVDLSEEAISGEHDLAQWVQHCLEFVTTLPPK